MEEKYTFYVESFKELAERTQQLQMKKENENFTRIKVEYTFITDLTNEEK